MSTSFTQKWGNAIIQKGMVYHKISDMSKRVDQLNYPQFIFNS